VKELKTQARFQKEGNGYNGPKSGLQSPWTTTSFELKIGFSTNNIISKNFSNFISNFLTNIAYYVKERLVLFGCGLDYG
jgi:hypothetical protein